MNAYKEVYEKSIFDAENFWREQAKNIDWFTFPNTILKNQSNDYQWFTDGKLNTSYLCLDYHVNNGRANQHALIYDSPVTQTKQYITYKQLLEKVALFAGVLKNNHIEKGDRVIIYMPMIPETVVAMLACARVGAIHSVVFGGFAPKELATRIDDAKPKLILMAGCGIEVNKIVDYKAIVDEAVSLASHKINNIIIYKRPQKETSFVEGRDLDWNEELKTAQKQPCTELNGTDPLYILYTSGTTGKPKGIVRENGGHAVAMKYSMHYVYDCKPGETFWAASDVGWVVGHSYIVYAPLINGNTTILFEGKPVGTPDASTFWRVISEHKVSKFFTAPTAVRAIKKEDPHALLLKKHDVSCLKTFFLAGERLDPPTHEWLVETLNIPIIDHWWQTETGWAIVANPMGVEPHKVKKGSSTLPVPGYNIQVLDDEGKKLGKREQGNIVIQLPMPPSCARTIWNDRERFESNYLNEFDGYYLTGDGGYIDDDGYIFILGRIDDVINVAGHRLSTGEMEEVVGKHEAVAECAVVGIEDSLKGEIPIGFYVKKDGVKQNNEKIEEELIALVRKEIGPVAVFKRAICVDKLPKTRSGKILRKTIRLIAQKKEYPIPNTIDDISTLDYLEKLFEKIALTKK